MAADWSRVVVIGALLLFLCCLSGCKAALDVTDGAVVLGLYHDLGAKARVALCDGSSCRSLAGVGPAGLTPCVWTDERVRPDARASAGANDRTFGLCTSFSLRAVLSWRGKTEER